MLHDKYYLPERITAKEGQTHVEPYRPNRDRDDR